MRLLSRLPSRSPHRSLLLAGAALAGVAASPALADPAHVILTVPAGTKMPADLPTRVAGWRQSGAIADAIWLNGQGDDAAFTTFVELDFPSVEDYRRWAEVDAPQVQAPVVIDRADAVVHGETYPRDSNHSIFQVETFRPGATPAQFDEFAKKYVKPLMEGERPDKTLMRYTLYRTPGAVPGKAWLLAEYRDPTAFGRAPALAAAVTTRLSAASPDFARLDQAKTAMRGGDAITTAQYRELPPPELANLPAYKPDKVMTGTLRIYGSELKNAVEYLARGFQRFHPDLRISWSNATSSEGAIAGLYTGVSDIAPMGDDAKLTDEMPFYNVTSYLPTEISVATGGYERRGSLWAWVIAVNKDNPLDAISIDELKNIFGSERSGGWEQSDNNWLYSAKYGRTKASNIRTWDQVGLKGGYAKREIQTYGFSAPGFQAAFERHWFNWSHKWNPNIMEYVERKEAVAGADGDAVASERPLEILSKDRYGMAIAGLLHVKDYPDLKILKLSEHKGGPAISFTPANVANRSYPLKRDAYFYINRAPGRPVDPIVREFMRYVLSREGQEIIAQVGYYYPLDADFLAEQRKKLD